jgi:hypothetical protein
MGWFKHQDTNDDELNYQIFGKMIYMQGHEVQYMGISTKPLSWKKFNPNTGSGQDKKRGLTDQEVIDFST